MEQEIKQLKEMANRLRFLVSDDIKKSEVEPVPYISKETPVPSDETGGESIAAYYKKHPIAHEYHHATHALTFLFYMAYWAVRGERTRRRTLARAIHHLMDLREFLEEGEMTDCVNTLYAGLQFEYDQSLGVFRRGIHKGVRAVARRMGLREGDSAFSRMNSVLIAASEDEKEPQICMYPWLVANQERILKFAAHYGKQEIFRGLLPLENKSHA